MPTGRAGNNRIRHTRAQVELESQPEEDARQNALLLRSAELKVPEKEVITFSKINQTCKSILKLVNSRQDSELDANEEARRREANCNQLAKTLRKTIELYKNVTEAQAKHQSDVQQLKEMRASEEAFREINKKIVQESLSRDSLPPELIEDRKKNCQKYIDLGPVVISELSSSMQLIRTFIEDLCNAESFLTEQGVDDSEGPDSPLPSLDDLTASVQTALIFYDSYIESLPILKLETQLHEKVQAIKEAFIRQITAIELNFEAPSGSNASTLPKNLTAFCNAAEDFDNVVNLIAQEKEAINALMTETQESYRTGLAEIAPQINEAARTLLLCIQNKIRQLTVMGENMETITAEIENTIKTLTLWADEEKEIPVVLQRIAETKTKLETIEDDFVGLKALVDLQRTRGRLDKSQENKLGTMQIEMGVLQNEFRKWQSKLTFLTGPSGYPEYRSSVSQFTTSDKISSTGLVAQKSLSDFDQIRTISKSRYILLHAKIGEKNFAIKGFRLENEVQRKGFEREISILHRIQHELIIPIVSVFYEETVSDGLVGYIQMPHVSFVDLTTWVEENPCEEDISNMLRLIVQGISYLHVRGVIHRGLCSFFLFFFIFINIDPDILFFFFFSTQHSSHLRSSSVTKSL